MEGVGSEYFLMLNHFSAVMFNVRQYRHVCCHLHWILVIFITKNFGKQTIFNIISPFVELFMLSLTCIAEFHGMEFYIFLPQTYIGVIFQRILKPMEGRKIMKTREQYDKSIEKH